MANGQPVEITTDLASHGAGAMVRKGETAGSVQQAETGKFGRLFDLPPLVTTETALIELGEAMQETLVQVEGADPARFTEDPARDNPGVPAGFTYLGQFVDHDITFDPTSLKERKIDPEALQNFRTPAFDLDSVYGGGRAVQPYVFQRRNPDADPPGDPDKFTIGMTTRKEGTPERPETFEARPNDLPRAPNGLAIIADPRNDENLIVAQLHLAFMKFHNHVVDELRARATDKSASVFDEARRIVVWHYQWLVVHDFLRRILDRDELHDALTSETTIMDNATYPFMPIEFSMAAYRLGHSMVRESYQYNRAFPQAGLGLLFLFSGRSSSPNAGTTPIPGNWIINWKNFFNVDPEVRPQASRKIDTLIAPALFALRNVAATAGDDEADKSAALSVRNLARGHRARLPSGQAVAEHFGLIPVSEEILGDDSPTGVVLRRHGLHRHTPLWFYILKEAEVHAAGRRLGRVGSRIVAQVFAGLLRRDEDSYLNAPTSWRPTLTSATPGHFTMADLLALVGDVNPLGDAAPVPANAANNGNVAPDLEMAEVRGNG